MKLMRLIELASLSDQATELEVEEATQLHAYLTSSNVEKFGRGCVGIGDIVIEHDGKAYFDASAEVTT